MEHGGIYADASKAEDAGLKKRMRIFIEAIVKMVCPVFLAACVSLAKLDMGDQPGVRDSFSILAGCTLASGILSLLLLVLPHISPHRFPDKLAKCSSTCFIYLCGLLLMVVAYLTLVLISKRYVSLWLALVIIGGCTLYCGIVSFMTLRKGHPQGTTVFGKYLDELENSVDFSAAITFLLFLGLGGLVLGGQYRTIYLREVCLTEMEKAEEKEALLLLFHTIWLSFVICLVGVLFMLVCMVPPATISGSKRICRIIDGCNYLFGGALTCVVLLITYGTLRNLVVLGFASVLSVIPYQVWPVLFITGGAIGGGEEVKPASLDLTKVTFTGFLAISVYTVSENTPVSIREYSSWFIFFTAIAVNNFIGWRLFTHRKNPSAARFTAANVASLCAHIYIIVAVIPFAGMAFNAFKKITSTTAPSPAPSPSCL